MGRSGGIVDISWHCRFPTPPQDMPLSTGHKPPATMQATMETITVAPSVKFRDLGGESVLLELESGRYFGLDEVATRMWTLLVEHRTVAPILDTLEQEYDVDGARLRADLTSFITKLEEHSLIRRQPARTPTCTP